MFIDIHIYIYIYIYIYIMKNSLFEKILTQAFQGYTPFSRCPLSGLTAWLFYKLKLIIMYIKQQK